MARYGKGTARRSRPFGKYRQCVRVYEGPGDKRGTRLLKKLKPLWHVENTDLTSVSQTMGFDIRKHVRDLLRKVSNPVVVDWGPAEGRAITELAEEFPQARCHGFGDTAYEDWRGNEHVQFVHAPAEDFRMHFEDNSIDFMFSHSGLKFVEREISEAQRKIGQRQHVSFKEEYIVQSLVPKLKVGGKLLTDPVDLGIFQNLPGVKTESPQVFEFNGMRIRVEKVATHYGLITRLS